MIKKLILFLIKKTPFLNNYFLGVATIFMLHRVDIIDRCKIPANENMKITPVFLENFILNAKAKGFDFISLDDLYFLLENRKSARKKIVITLDDGYIDNFTQAYPIFRKHHIPFTIYITSSFPEQNAILWWYVLEDLLDNYSEISLSDGSNYMYTNLNEKNRVFLEIRDKILKLDQINLLQELNQLFSSYSIDWYSRVGELAMSWEQIRQLSMDPLVTIGGHTKNHYAFNRISNELIIQEINDANNLIKQQLDKEVEHFAFPFGSIHEVEQQQIDRVKELGFKTIVTTRRGNIFRKHKDYLYCLPRIMLIENFSLEDMSIVKEKYFATV